jgi:hypothetical protein
VFGTVPTSYPGLLAHKIRCRRNEKAPTTSEAGASLPIGYRFHYAALGDEVWPQDMRPMRGRSRSPAQCFCHEAR